MGDADDTEDADWVSVFISLEMMLALAAQRLFQLKWRLRREREDHFT